MVMELDCFQVNNQDFFSLRTLNIQVVLHTTEMPGETGVHNSYLVFLMKNVS